MNRYKVTYKKFIGGKVDGRGYTAPYWEAGHHFELVQADSEADARLRVTISSVQPRLIVKVEQR